MTVFENSVPSFLPDVVLLLDDLAVGEVAPVGAGRPRPGARRHGEQPESRDQDREGRGRILEREPRKNPTESGGSVLQVKTLGIDV